MYQLCWNRTQLSTRGHRAQPSPQTCDQFLSGLVAPPQIHLAIVCRKKPTKLLDPVTQVTLSRACTAMHVLAITIAHKQSPRELEHSFFSPQSISYQILYQHATFRKKEKKNKINMKNLNPRIHAARNTAAVICIMYSDGVYVNISIILFNGRC